MVDEASRPPETDGVALVEAVANGGISESEAAAWTTALLPLVKGKTTLDKEKMAQTSDALREVERANGRGSFAREVLKVSNALKPGQVFACPSRDWLLTGNVGLGERAGGHGAEAWRTRWRPVWGCLWFTCACTDVGRAVERGVW